MSVHSAPMLFPVRAGVGEALVQANRTGWGRPGRAHAPPRGRAPQTESLRSQRQGPERVGTGCVNGRQDAGQIPGERIPTRGAPPLCQAVNGTLSARRPQEADCVSEPEISL